MNAVRLYLILWLIIGLTECSSPKNDWVRDHLIGKVKILTILEKEIQESTNKPKLIKKTVIKYDESGNQIEWSQYDENNIEKKGKQFYDSKGHKMGLNIYDERGNLVHQSKYRYDNTGNMIESIDSSMVFRTRTIYEYESGQCNTMKILDEKDQLITTSHMKYDQNGNTLSSIYSGPNHAQSDSVIATFTYSEYDKVGNWTKSEAKINNGGKKGVGIVEREIEYY